MRSRAGSPSHAIRSRSNLHQIVKRATITLATHLHLDGTLRRILPQDFERYCPLVRDSPHDSRAEVNICAFPTFPQDRRELRTAAGTWGGRNGGRRRLELLRELLPSTTTVALLANPNNPNFGADPPETEAAANALGRRLEVLRATTERDLDAAFTTIVERQAGALVVMSDPFFFARREQLMSGASLLE